MCVLWRYRLATPLLAVLLFIVCEAQIDNEAQISKLYPRGNHWAVGILEHNSSRTQLFGGDFALVRRKSKIILFGTFIVLYRNFLLGHLMGKKSIDELLNERDSGGDERNLTTEKQRETLTQPSGSLRALVKALAGAEEQRRLRKEQEALKQAAKMLLILTLNTRDSSGN